MLVFNVLVHDFNRNEIKPYNIITDSLLKDIKKQRRNSKITSRLELKEYLKSEFMYHYWCKSEYEILMKGLSKSDEEDKIDVWFQINMNLDLITQLIEQELKLRFK